MLVDLVARPQTPFTGCLENPRDGEPVGLPSREMMVVGKTRGA